MGISHGSRRCVFDCGGQQHCWRRIIGTCIGGRCIGNPINGIRRSGGLLRGCVIAIQSYRKPKVVAVRTGLSQADADKRVSDVINQAKTALDDARKAAAKLSLWLTASLLIGAFAASLAATEGGYVRDNWNPGLTGR
jgi:hypothetical protein